MSSVLEDLKTQIQNRIKTGISLVKHGNRVFFLADEKAFPIIKSYERPCYLIIYKGGPIIERKGANYYQHTFHLFILTAGYETEYILKSKADYQSLTEDIIELRDLMRDEKFDTALDNKLMSVDCNQILTPVTSPILGVEGMKIMGFAAYMGLVCIYKELEIT